MIEAISPALEIHLQPSQLQPMSNSSSEVSQQFFIERKDGSKRQILEPAIIEISSNEIDTKRELSLYSPEARNNRQPTFFQPPSIQKRIGSFVLSHGNTDFLRHTNLVPSPEKQQI